MAVAVVDTGVLIGMVDVDDEHHDTAMDIVRAMDHGDLPTGRVTNYIVLETLNWIYNRKRHKKAVETYERLHQYYHPETGELLRYDNAHGDADLGWHHRHIRFSEDTEIEFHGLVPHMTRFLTELATLTDTESTHD